MKKNFLLSAAALVLSLGAQAQVEDVTSQYITNPGFEECEALPVVEPAEGDYVQVSHVNLMTSYSVAGGTDYADKGWTLVAPLTNANAGVVEFGVNIKTGQWSSYAAPMAPAEGSTGTKALCFTGSTPVVYQSPEVELPAGYYRLTCNTFVYSGWSATSSVPANNTGFVANDGTKYLSKKLTFNSNAVNDAGEVIKDDDGNTTHLWDSDVVEILLPEPTKGHFQVSYGISTFYVAVDDVKVEYEARVITTALELQLAKAKALSTEFNDSDPELSAAIQAAEGFIANPTTQEDVADQVTLLVNAMKTALENSFEPVDLSTSYVANFSFEDANTEGWTGENITVATSNPRMPYDLDGTYYAYFGWQATTFAIEQTVSGLPEGYYYVEALLMGSNPVKLVLNDTETEVTPVASTNFSKHFGQTVFVDGGTIKIGAKADASFNIDAIRLIFCTDEDLLSENVYNTVVADATAVLNAEANAIITGEERTALQNAIEATEGSYTDLIDAINAAVSAFAASKADYQKFETAKTNAAAYTLDTYPYADPAIYEEIQNLCATVATSASDAERLSQALPAACEQLVDSHYNLEGVTDKVDYTAQLVNWTLNGLQADTESGEGYYTHTQELYQSNPAEGSMELTLTLPAGKYAFVCDARAGYYAIPTLYANDEAIAVLPHSGMTVYQSGVGYVPGWKKDIYSFELAGDGDLTLKVGITFTTNYPDYYHAEFGIGNMQLFKVADITEVTEQVDIDRIVDQGYTPQTVTVDFAAAKAFLGVDELTTDMLRIINPDGSQISDYAPYDGWFNREGTAETWGANTFTCVKFFQAIPDGAYTICDMNNPAVDDKFSCKWALTANDKTYIYQINVTYVAAPAIEKTVVDLGIVASVEYETTEGSYVEKTVTLSDEQVNAILAELELTDLSEATVAGYNPSTQELVSNYAGYDGWRNAQGDFQNWTGNSTVPACVKYTDGKTYNCYNIYGCEPQTIATFWAICNETKAVLVEIDFIYTSVVDGIGSINLSAGTKAPVYNLNGQRISSLRKGLNIVDGKKVMVK